MEDFPPNRECRLASSARTPYASANACCSRSPLDLLARTAELLQPLEAEEPDPFRAIAQYMHSALDLRISALVPALHPPGPVFGEHRSRMLQGRVCAALYVRRDGCLPRTG